MKILPFIFIFLSLSIFAQNTDVEVTENSTKTTFKRHEVRLIAERFSIFNKRRSNNHNVLLLSRGIYLFGIGYNYNFNKISLTSKLCYYESPIEFSSLTPTLASNSSESYFEKVIKVGVGAAYNKRLNILTIYAGTNINYFTSMKRIKNYKSETYGYIVEPNIGLKIHLFNFLSINPELYFAFGTYNSNPFYNPYSSSSKEVNSENHYRNTAKLLGNLSINFSF